MNENIKAPTSPTSFVITLSIFFFYCHWSGPPSRSVFLLLSHHSVIKGPSTTTIWVRGILATKGKSAVPTAWLMEPACLWTFIDHEVPCEGAIEHYLFLTLDGQCKNLDQPNNVNSQWIELHGKWGNGSNLSEHQDHRVSFQNNTYSWDPL